MLYCYKAIVLKGSSSGPSCKISSPPLHEYTMKKLKSVQYVSISPSYSPISYFDYLLQNVFFFFILVFILYFLPEHNDILSVNQLTCINRISGLSSLVIHENTTLLVSESTILYLGTSLQTNLLIFLIISKTGHFFQRHIFLLENNFRFQ